MRKKVQMTKRGFRPMQIPEWKCTIYLPVATDWDIARLKSLRANHHPNRFQDVPKYDVAAHIIRDNEGQTLISPEEASRLDASIVNRIIKRFVEISPDGKWLQPKPTKEVSNVS